MSVPSPALVEHQRWAKVGISHVGDAHADSLLWQSRCIGSSSMFSGCGYPERALQYIDVARREVMSAAVPLTETWHSRKRGEGLQ